MSVNAMHRPVVHWTHPQAAFERTPRLLDPLPLLVPQRQVGRGQAIVLAMHHAFAVELCGRTLFGRLNPQELALGQMQRTTRATTRLELAHPFAVAFTLYFL